MVFAFAPIGIRDTRSMGRVFNRDLTVLQGFYDDGTIDAMGGGMICTDFRSYCTEDLIAIEKWLRFNLWTEVKRKKKYDAAVAHGRAAFAASRRPT